MHRIVSTATAQLQHPMVENDRAIVMFVSADVCALAAQEVLLGAVAISTLSTEVVATLLVPRHYWWCGSCRADER